MAKQKPQGQQWPELVKCPECGRRLERVKYEANPPRSIPPERRRQYRMPTSPMFTIGCPCGIYTTFTPWDPDPEVRAREEAEKQAISDRMYPPPTEEPSR
jgi:hypothetical protein